MTANSACIPPMPHDHIPDMSVSSYFILPYLYLCSLDMKYFKWRASFTPPRCSIGTSDDEDYDGDEEEDGTCFVVVVFS